MTHWSQYRGYDTREAMRRDQAHCHTGMFSTTFGHVHTEHHTQACSEAYEATGTRPDTCRLVQR